MRNLSMMHGLLRNRCSGSLSLFATLGILAGCATPAPVAELPAPKIMPPDPMAFEIAEAAVNEGRYGDAKQVLQRIFSSDPKNLHGKLLLAEIVLATGAPVNAIRRFDEIAAQNKFVARTLQGKGLAFFKLKDMAKGQKFLTLATEKDPTLWRSFNALGYFYDSTQNWTNASESYDQAIKLRPKLALLHNNRGFSRLLQKRFQESINDLQSAIRLKPDLMIARLNLQLAMAWKGDYARAALGVEKNKKGEALNNIGYVALLRGDLGTAEAHFIRALETDAAYNKTAHRNLGYLQNLKEVRKIEKARDSKSTIMH